MVPRPVRAIRHLPLTHGALDRFLLRHGGTGHDAVAVLHGLGLADGHEFWPDALGYEEVDLCGVVGHKQVTDAYLAALGRSRGGRLATLGRALSILHEDVAVLLGDDS